MSMGLCPTRASRAGAPLLKTQPCNNENQTVKKSLRSSIDFSYIKHFPTQRTQLNSGEGNDEKTTKNHLLQDSPAFFCTLRIPASLKKKHKRNQLEVTNYFFLLWKRNMPYNIPKSNYITGVTSALLYFKVTGKSDADHFGDFGPFLWNTWVFSSKASAPDSRRKKHQFTQHTKCKQLIFESLKYKLGATLYIAIHSLKNSKFEITIIITITLIYRCQCSQLISYFIDLPRQINK